MSSLINELLLIILILLVIFKLFKNILLCDTLKYFPIVKILSCGSLLIPIGVLSGLISNLLCNGSIFEIWAIPSVIWLDEVRLFVIILLVFRLFVIIVFPTTCNCSLGIFVPIPILLNEYRVFKLSSLFQRLPE